MGVGSGGLVAGGAGVGSGEIVAGGAGVGAGGFVAGGVSCVGDGMGVGGAAVGGSDRAVVGDGKLAAGDGAPPHDVRNSARSSIDVKKRRIWRMWLPLKAKN